LKKLKEKLAIEVLDVYADILDVTILSKASTIFRLEANRIRRKHGLKLKLIPQIPKRKRKH